MKARPGMTAGVFNAPEGYPQPAGPAWQSAACHPWVEILPNPHRIP